MTRAEEVLAGDVINALHDASLCFANCGRTKSECEPRGLCFQKEEADAWVCPQCWHSGAAWDVWVREFAEMRHWSLGPTLKADWWA